MDDRGTTGAGARATVFAGSSVALGVVAHVLTGGPAPALGAVLFLVVVCGLLWAGVAGAVEQTLPRLLAGVVAVQVGLHVALLGQEHGHHAHAAVMAGAAPGHGLTLSALAGHLLASLLLAGWLRGGERAVWSAVRRLADRLLLAPPRPLHVPAILRRPEPTGPNTVPPAACAVRLPARRGPPVPA